MSALFRSLPWNSRRGRDTLGRVWLPCLLIVAALLLSVRSGVWVARGPVMPLYLLIGGLGFAVLLARPDLALFVIPIGISIPRTAPRLFGVIGMLEAILPLAGAAWVGKLVLHRRRIRTNAVLNLALLAAVPIVVSGVTGRGDQDWVRAYTWLGGCITYLLALNLPPNRRTVERVLLWTALVIVGMMCLDYLTGSVHSPEDTSSQYVYRKVVLDFGESNVAAAMLAVVMPILAAYVLLAADRRQRWVSIIGLTLGVLLGLLLLSRIFWMGMIIGLIAQTPVLWKTRGGRYVLVTLLLLGALVGLVSLLMPDVAGQTGKRLQSTAGEWRQAIAVLQASAGEDPEVWMRIPLSIPRVSLSVIQLRAAAQSPLWGRGANRIGSRFAHAVIPTALYDYGLVFALPLLGVLGLWLRQAIRQVRGADHEEGSAFSLAHLGVVAGIAGAIFLNDFLITVAGYLCLAFLIAGLLGATVFDQEQEPARAS